MKIRAPHIVIVVLLLLFSCISYAQIKTNVSFSDSRLEKAKALNKTRKEFKKYTKDSLKQIKKLNKKYDIKIDSLAEQMAEQAKRRTSYYQAKQGLDSLKKVNKDSLKANSEDWSEEAYNEKKKTYMAQMGIDSSYLKYTNLDSLSINELWKSEDSLLYKQQAKAMKAFETEAISQAGIDGISQPPALPDSENPLDAEQLNFNRFKDGKTLKNNMDKFPKMNLEKMNTSLNEAHKKMGALKKKYVSIPSMDDLKGAIKINSLKGQPMGQRIKWGGSFTVTQKDDLMNIDLAPSVAYRLTKKLSTGIELMYRTKFGDGRSISSSFASDTYGGRLFNEYIFIKSIYVHAEYEVLNTKVKSNLDDTLSTEIVLGAMAGLGNSFTLTDILIGKINILYNFLHEDDNPIYSSPWVIRFGIEFKKKK